MTEGYIEIGDATKALQISVLPSSAALVALVANQKVGMQMLTRLTLSLHEVDETAKPIPHMGSMEIGIRVKAVNK